MTNSLEPAGFNTLDWTLVVLAGISTLRGLMRGLVRTLFSSLGLVGGLLLATWFYGPLARMLRPTITNPTAAMVTAFLLIALGTPLLGSLLGGVARGVVSAVGLGFLDRLGGAALGAARGGLLAMAVVVPMAAFLPNLEWIRGSTLAPGLLREAHAVSFIVPEDFRRRLVMGRVRLLRLAPSLLDGL